MTRFVQLVVDGLGQGSIYALLAIGFVIIYKATRVISFAQPALMVTGACFVIYLATELHWNFFLSIALAVAATAVV
ncbi:MAG: ABC transporter permease subunit, partial [Actinomycetota bacterium]